MEAWIWVLIPLAAIMVGAFKEWLKFKEKQDRLGASTGELENTVSALEAELEASEKQRKALERRIQNLETIVTSQAWDALHSADRSEQMQIDGGPLSLPENEEEGTDEERAARLARRLKI